MDTDIITKILEKPEYINFAFEIEEQVGLLKKAIVDHYRISLVTKLESRRWIVFENLDFGESNAYLVFFKRHWKMQLTLFFEQSYSNLRIGISPQFQVDADKESEIKIRQRLSELPRLESPSDKYWIWLASMELSNFSWREIYEECLTEKTLSKIDEICRLAGMVL